MKDKVTMALVGERDLLVCLARVSISSWGLPLTPTPVKNIKLNTRNIFKEIVALFHKILGKIYCHSLTTEQISGKL